MKLYYFNSGYRGGIVCLANSREEAAQLFKDEDPKEYGLEGVMPIDEIVEMDIPKSPQVVCEFYGDR